jgi:Cu/Ag efflux protein CusF
MRSRTGALAAALMLSTMFSTGAFAAEAEGKIQTVDRDNLTITLENGNSYKLPGEFDVDAIKEGMQVLLAYDKVGDQNMITDMELSE